MVRKKMKYSEKRSIFLICSSRYTNDIRDLPRSVFSFRHWLFQLFEHLTQFRRDGNISSVKRPAEPSARTWKIWTTSNNSSFYNCHHCSWHKVAHFCFGQLPTNKETNPMFLRLLLLRLQSWDRISWMRSCWEKNKENKRCLQLFQISLGSFLARQVL